MSLDRHRLSPTSVDISGCHSGALGWPKHRGAWGDLQDLPRKGSSLHTGRHLGPKSPHWAWGHFCRSRTACRIRSQVLDDHLSTSSPWLKVTVRYRSVQQIVCLLTVMWETTLAPPRLFLCHWVLSLKKYTNMLWIIFKCYSICIPCQRLLIYFIRYLLITKAIWAHSCSLYTAKDLRPYGLDPQLLLIWP